MPRNPSTGIYSKPAGTTPSVGQIIDPAPWNQLTSDLGNEITNSLPRDGSAPMVAPLKAASGTASAPGFGFASNPQTGVYLKGSGLLGFTQNGVDVTFEKGMVYAAKAGDYTALASDDNAVHRFTASATLTLTAAATLGANWHYVVLADGGDVTIDPSGSETIDGASTLIVRNGYSATIYCTGSAFFTDKLIARLDAKADASAVGSFVIGGILSNNAGTPNTHIDIAAGSFRSGSAFVSSGSTLTKRLDASWAAGSGNGGLDTGTKAANTTYRIWPLRKTADGTADFVFSISTSSGGVTVPAGYTVVAPNGLDIGMILTDSAGNIIRFVQDGNYFRWNVSSFPNDLSTTANRTTSLLTCTLPTGRRVLGLFQTFISTNATGTDVIMEIADGLNANVTQFIENYGSNGSSRLRAVVEQFTNTSAQVNVGLILSPAPAANANTFQTVGWRDYQIPRIGA
ncbi:hypothetical protein FHT70_005260 [Rhizobium sp. BK049]|uniref:hypothetical protein n=1 Tax=Rhizobium sp. BK049 TaxID=2587095 RepID=UPI00161CD150|nr:hypothetical protein [Rhizobium sp. BK049]MBB3355299.1 hypothetical protein [Rhizobium sp. BK049]